MNENANSSQALQVLNSSELLGRQFTIYGTAEEPLFLAKNVAEMVDVANISDLMSRIDDDEKKLVNTIGLTDTISAGNPYKWFLTEDGLYEVLMQSRKPIAKVFKKGVKTILKQVRSTGGYIPTTAEETPEEIMAKALQIAQATIERKQKELENSRQRVLMLEGKTEAQQKQIGELAPKAEYTDTVLMSTTTYTMTEVAKEFGYSANTFSKKLRDCGILFYQSGRWMLTAKYQGQGFMNTRTHQFYHNDGTVGTNTISVWTEKGRKFLHDFRNGKFRSTRGNAQDVQPLN